MLFLREGAGKVCRCVSERQQQIYYDLTCFVIIEEIYIFIVNTLENIESNKEENKSL